MKGTPLPSLRCTFKPSWSVLFLRTPSMAQRGRNFQTLLERRLREAHTSCPGRAIALRRKFRACALRTLPLRLAQSKDVHCRGNPAVEAPTICRMWNLILLLALLSQAAHSELATQVGW